MNLKENLENCKKKTKEITMPKMQRVSFKSSFSICRLDNIYLKKYGFTLVEYRKNVRKILDILFGFKEIQKSKIFTEDIKKIRFDIAFCKNEKIQEINRDYRNKDAATDVITFSLFNDDENSIIYRKTADLGQIIINVEMLKNKDDFIELTTHGILHLIGFDHLTKKDYDFVVGVQKKVLKEFNE